jgi:hypothetical protein
LLAFVCGRTALETLTLRLPEPPAFAAAATRYLLLRLASSLVELRVSPVALTGSVHDAELETALAAFDAADPVALQKFLLRRQQQQQQQQQLAAATKAQEATKGREAPAEAKAESTAAAAVLLPRLRVLVCSEAGVSVAGMSLPALTHAEVGWSFFLFSCGSLLRPPLPALCLRSAGTRLTFCCALMAFFRAFGSLCARSTWLTWLSCCLRRRAWHPASPA